MVRLVIREVIVDSKRAEGRVWVQINWQTGAQEQFWYQRRVSSYAVFAGAQALEQRLRELNAERMMDAQIAAALEREGYQTPGLVHPITSKIVCHLRAKWKIPTVKLNNNQQNPAQWEDGSYSVEGAAAKLGVDQSTIFTWLKTGRLKGEHLGRSMPWKIYLTEDDERRLHEWLRCQGCKFWNCVSENLVITWLIQFLSHSDIMSHERSQGLYTSLEWNDFCRQTSAEPV